MHNELNNHTITYSEDISNNISSKNNEKFTPKEIQILDKNKKFFSTDIKYVLTMLKIINGESDISIRVLDWFVANYSKKNNTYYNIKKNGKCDRFYVHNEYKNQLNGYSKQYFDPFCRKKKVAYKYTDKISKNVIQFESSIGQLNFFQWAIRNKIIRYVELHLKIIEEDMKETTKKNKEKKQNSQSQEISNSIEMEVSDDPDPNICLSSSINSICLSPVKKTSSASKSDSDKKNKRQQLSKSVYDHGIKKYDYPIQLDFD
ncbi:hypothetical protein [Acanthamoeba castellanii mimivirus]|uniref:Uncharacterized protein L507 n=5 Tax=Mimivirus TaxID=315393 RepID=YL507_MIMIV|nr:hypothetical protein MIMI_gp0546 [Acanthamoeba polyphaga mimivirus]Q5UQ75.1 RecName: Full=Uncharacterized protein L507 [Acanthamoeba polyphaga mimivirus]AEQ60700.1 hypothetical protein [Acanthamoeba castellanii mamavirus]AHA45345.1 hypothetical protein HIRU_S439 [Hirudovirus strain Sangsue]AHJ40177.2 hypothetical protein [Samba virus]ALR84097.1 hypothetical protein [Niemeyer virus]AMZ02952.1 hypothetical protein [Mimivirus Bombay]QTF49428.1 hypothetical protein [Mimivirus reunion]WMV6187